MSAFFIATGTIKSGELMQQYALAASSTLKPFGAKSITRGKFKGTLHGELKHDMVGIIEFPSIEAMEDWYNSPAYQAIIPLRESAADMVFAKYETIC
jgi:uncharacterized protein (DUF1330 family)